MFEYKQTTGELMLMGADGTPAVALGVCYSGRGDGLNNPAMQYTPDVGPIPQGTYTIGEAFEHPVAGPVCMRLTPDGASRTHGRSGFMLHGDNCEMDHTASEGCIIAALEIRQAVSAARDGGVDQLVVTE